MNILFDDRQNFIKIDETLYNEISRCISIALEMEGIKDEYIEVSVSFVTNEEIKNLNREFRNKDSITDVLSFPMYDNIELVKYENIPIILGDIVISTEKAVEQSIEFNHSKERELLYLVCHSIFHLLGYDHITIEEKEVMRSREKETMKKMGIFKNV